MNTDAGLVFRFLFQLWKTWHKILFFIQNLLMVIHTYILLKNVIHSHFDEVPDHGYSLFSGRSVILSISEIMLGGGSFWVVIMNVDYITSLWRS